MSYLGKSGKMLLKFCHRVYTSNRRIKLTYNSLTFIMWALYIQLMLQNFPNKYWLKYFLRSQPFTCILILITGWLIIKICFFTKRHYLALKFVIVTWFVEELSSVICDDPVSVYTWRVTKAGAFGLGRLIISPTSIDMITEVFGLSLANVCTHNNPTCIHLRISSWLSGLDIDGWISKMIEFSFHNFQAWKYY